MSTSRKDASALKSLGMVFSKVEGWHHPVNAAQYTPLPWVLVEHEDMFTVDAVRIDGGRELCVMPVGSAASYQANARLIAAAPELLETLTGMHKALARMIYKHDNDSIESEWLSHSNEAIRKATGHDIQY